MNHIQFPERQNKQKTREITYACGRFWGGGQNVRNLLLICHEWVCTESLRFDRYTRSAHPQGNIFFVVFYDEGLQYLSSRDTHNAIVLSTSKEKSALPILHCLLEFRCITNTRYSQLIVFFYSC